MPRPVVSTRLRRMATSWLILSVGCAGRSSPPAALGPDAELSPAERVTHVLSRLTFGPRPGDAESVAAMGVNRWIDLQLHPESIPDSALTAVLASIVPWSAHPYGPATALTATKALAATPVAVLAKDTAAMAQLRRVQVQLIAVARTLTNYNDQLYAGKIAHAQMGERQLLEVVTDFWENHFSVFSGKVPFREALTSWDRETLRPHAFGKFRDLLGAVAHSPEMLYYLDNWQSRKNGLNENYARELLELHTLGVDGGYTQHDVVEVARALTGWSIRRGQDSSVFVFLKGQHDTGQKVVLGHVLPAGRGIEDGEEVLDILARHPSTAHYIAFKLARRLVSDEPPVSLVDRAARTFSRTDGDIAAVVRTIVTSPEFFSRSAFRAKVKTPFELVVSVRRALDAPPDTTVATARLIAQLGQAFFGWLTPDGWPERGAAWMNSGTLYNRIRFGGNVADGKIPGIRPDRWRRWASLAGATTTQQVDGVIADVLGGSAEPATRSAMFAVADSGDVAGDGARRLRGILAIALASPEFQRR